MDPTSKIIPDSYYGPDAEVLGYPAWITGCCQGLTVYEDNTRRVTLTTVPLADSHCAVTEDVIEIAELAVTKIREVRQRVPLDPAPVASDVEPVKSVEA